MKIIDEKETKRAVKSSKGSKEKSKKGRKKSAKASQKGKKLLIVESPTKAKTINRYLGNDYKVVSCMGHVIDLPKSRLAVDIENGYKPDYITVRGKGKILQMIKRYGKDSSEVLLAPDPDREGEAIAYHLKNVLQEKYQDLPIRRVVFNEITKDVINEAVKNPHDVNESLVNAQKARRILDRLVGYSISPLLWEKIKKGLSAGRVQSVALNLICRKEEEIRAFDPKEYWTLDLKFTRQGQKKVFESSFMTYENEKKPLNKKETVDEVIEKIEGKKAVIESIKDSKRSRNPLPPYITSKLQQEAATRLNFSSAKTMMIAQRLYEGINTGGETTGLITYMRTDSVRISDVALNEVRNFIGHYYPENLPTEPNLYKSSSKAQDAHEAIRPTSVARVPDSIKDDLTKDEYKLYSLIWERFVSSQMTPVRFDNVKMIIKIGEARFGITGSIITDKGFSRVFKTLKLDSKTHKLPHFEEGEEVDVKEIFPEQHFTKPPSRYSDASIVKKLEETGIGRPSTYAPTINRIIKKYYVRRVKRKLVPTMVGELVNGLMEKYFTYLLDTGFTADMETQLDKVEEESIAWNDVLNNFYPHFKKTLDYAYEHMDEMKSVLDEETDQICPECGKPIIKKLGKHGFFLACSGFPDCRFTDSISLGACPKEGCKGKIVARKSKKGREFYGCNKYPECDFVSWNPPIDEKCPKCGHVLFETGSKKHGFFHECLNDECDHKVKVDAD